MKLSEKIYEQRKRLNLSQEALSEKLEVSRQSVSKWEADQATPELDKLIQLASIFGITLDELIHDTKATTEKSIQPIKAENSGAPKAKRSRRTLIFNTILTMAVLYYGGWSINKIQNLESKISYLESSSQQLLANTQAQMNNLINSIQSRLMTGSELLTDYEYSIESVDMANKTITYKLSFLVKDETALKSIVFTAMPKEGDPLTLEATTDGSGTYEAVLVLDMTQDLYTVSARFNYQSSIKNQSFGFFTGKNILNPDFSVMMDSGEGDSSGTKYTLSGLRLNGNRLAFMDGKMLLQGDMVFQVKDEARIIVFSQALDLQTMLSDVDIPGLTTEVSFSYPLNVPNNKLVLETSRRYTFSVMYFEEGKEPIEMPIGTLMVDSEGIKTTGNVY